MNKGAGFKMMGCSLRCSYSGKAQRRRQLLPTLKTTTFAFIVLQKISSYLIQYIKTISNNIVTIILGKQTSALQKEIINKSSI